MKLKLNSKIDELVPPGDHDATVVEVKDLQNDKAEIAFAVAGEGRSDTVKKPYKGVSKSNSDLHKDVEAIRGEPLPQQGEFDLASLKDKSCRVVVTHKRTSGGKMTAVVNTVLPAAKRTEVKRS